MYHKNPKFKVSDVLTGFCCAPKFCDGHTDTHCQFLTQLKLRIPKIMQNCGSTMLVIWHCLISLALRSTAVRWNPKSTEYLHMK